MPERLLTSPSQRHRQEPEIHHVQGQTDRRRENRIQSQRLCIFRIRERTVAAVVIDTGLTVTLPAASVTTYGQILRCIGAGGRRADDFGRVGRRSGNAAEFRQRPRSRAELFAVRAAGTGSGAVGAVLWRENARQLVKYSLRQLSSPAVVDGSVAVHDELMVPKELPDHEAAAAGAGLAYGIAVAVGVAVGPERGRQEELPAAPGVFVAGGHFVGEPDVIFVFGGSECAHWVAAMAISTRVCTSKAIKSVIGQSKRD